MYFFVVVISLFKRIRCHPDTLFNLHIYFVYNTSRQAVSLYCILYRFENCTYVRFIYFVKNTLFRFRNDVFHIVHTTIANFKGITVEDLM